MTNNIINQILDFNSEVIILGAGLAGSECAWQLANANINVSLIEQRPGVKSEAHKTENFAELVCSNSLKSQDPLSAPGQLKWELTELNSLIIKIANKNKVAAGQALAVNRDTFAQEVTTEISKHPNIQVINQSIDSFEQLIVSKDDKQLPVVIATGPLTKESFAKSLSHLLGEQLYFYDAIAPIIDGESINRDIVFAQNRYDKPGDSGDTDEYLNCPFDKEEYLHFANEVINAEKVGSKDFEKMVYFQGCQPIEALLEKGIDTPRFGPMKPRGITDPRTDSRPYAVAQLRREDNEGKAWNLVGFQTKLKYPEQKRIFKLIPGLENVEFFRLGSLHRNTYCNAPLLLNKYSQISKHPEFFLAGQITGVEGYLESCASGAYVAKMIIQEIKGSEEKITPPQTTALGALVCATFNGRAKNFQPININWGIVPLNNIEIKDKEKKLKLVQRAQRQFNQWKDHLPS